MNAYVQYATALSARGYSLEQIRTALSLLNLPEQAITSVIGALGSAANHSPINQGAILQAYVDRVRGAENLGETATEVDSELATHGVDEMSRKIILQLARAEPEPLQSPAVAAVAPGSSMAMTLPMTSEQLSQATSALISAADRLELIVESREANGSPGPTAQIAIKPMSKGKLGALLLCIVAFIVLFVQSLLSGEKTITWLGLIGMNVGATVGFELMLKRSSWQQVDRWLTATILQTGLFLPFLIKEIIRPIQFPPYTAADYLLLGGAVVALITLQFCNVKALQHLGASVFSVTYNSRILFATVLGWVFLSETVGLFALVGGLLIFLAIFIVKQKTNRSLTKQGIVFGLGAALAISVMNTCEKELIILVGYDQYIFPMFTIAAVIMWLVVFLRRTRAPFKLLIGPQSLLIMALRACAGIGFSYSLVFGPVAVSSYLSSLSVILLIVFGMVFLGERDYIKSKLLATIIALLGLTTILFDSF